MGLLVILTFILTCASYSSAFEGKAGEFRRPLVIAHRGVSGRYPEHTKLAYEKAFEEGADYIECDLAVTKDFQLICSHEPWLSNHTNINCTTSNEQFCGPPHPDFTDRLATYNLDDHDPDFHWDDKGNITDYFTYDFTLDELKTLRRKQHFPFRDQIYNWEFGIVTFQEYIDIAKSYGMGIYPEMKHTFATNKILQSRGGQVTMEELVFNALRNNGYQNYEDKCIVQAFDLPSLQTMRQLGSNLRLCFLYGNPTPLTSEFMDTLQSEQIYSLGLNKEIIVKGNLSYHIVSIEEDLVKDIRNRGMELTLYTLRNEHYFLYYDYSQDPFKEMETLFHLGIDAYFTDFPTSLNNFLNWKQLEYQMTENSAVSNQVTQFSLLHFLPFVLIISSVAVTQ